MIDTKAHGQRSRHLLHEIRATAVAVAFCVHHGKLRARLAIGISGEGRQGRQGHGGGEKYDRRGEECFAHSGAPSLGTDQIVWSMRVSNIREQRVPKIPPFVAKASRFRKTTIPEQGRGSSRIGLRTQTSCVTRSQPFFRPSYARQQDFRHT